MQTFISTIGKYRYGILSVFCILIALISWKIAFATVPSDKERSAAMLPDVVREEERTQEYADRNAISKLCKKAILACQAGDCSAFVESEDCAGF